MQTKTKTRTRTRKYRYRSRSKKGGKGTPTGECEKTYCKKIVDFAKKFSDEYLKKLESLPKDIKNETTTKLIKVLKTSKYKNALTKKAKQTCKLNFCNVGCKNTIFESSKDLPKEITDKFKDTPKILKLMIKAKKDLFGNKTSILKDNFYDKLSAKDIKKLKNEGAISGCVKTLPLTK